MITTMTATMLSFAVLFLMVDQFALLIAGNILFLIDSYKKTHAIYNPSTNSEYFIESLRSSARQTALSFTIHCFLEDRLILG